MSTQIVPQGPSWSKAIGPKIDEVVEHYEGNERECRAQALRDIINLAAAHHEAQSLTLGGMLLVIRNEKLYEALGYGSFREYIAQEKVGRVGRSQLYKYLAVADATPPPALSAPQLRAPVLDTQRPRLTLTPDFVAEHGIEKSYAMTQRWEGATPDQRAEMVATLDASSRDFYQTAYGKADKPSFSVEGDRILLWQDGVGSAVATLTTTDREERRVLLDRLNCVPRPRL